MRLSLVPPIDTRDGTVAKDGLCRNMLIENDELGEFSVIRPALVAAPLPTEAGSGQGIVEFDGELLSVYAAGFQEAAIPAYLGDGQVEIGVYTNGTRPQYGTRAVCSNNNGTVFAMLAMDADFRAAIWTETGGLQLLTQLTAGDETMAVAFGSGDYEYYLYGTSGPSSGAKKWVRWDVRDNTVTELSAAVDFRLQGIKASRHGLYFCGNVYASTTTWLWSEASGLVTWTPGVGTYTTVTGVSDNGTVIGFSTTGGSSYNIYRRVVSGAEQDLGSGIPRCISDNGLTIGGLSPYDISTPSNQKPFIWKAASGVVQLSANQGTVSCLSSDGTIAVGSYKDGLIWQPFRYNSDGTTTVFDLLEVPAITATVEGNVFITGNGLKVFCQVNDSSPVGTWFVVWEDGYELEPMAISSEGSTTNYTLSQNHCSHNGHLFVFSAFLGDDEFTYKWDRFNGRFRSIATLEGSFFDFAQSTL